MITRYNGEDKVSLFLMTNEWIDLGSNEMFVQQWQTTNMVIVRGARPSCNLGSCKTTQTTVRCIGIFQVKN